MSYRFSYEDDSPSRKISVEAPDDASLDNILEVFVCYLKATGFTVPEGSQLHFLDEGSFPD
jgi:hypothetical protein